ncbi:MAG: hypothetical protein BEU05_00825 [Marine Group III euryarchaeote CG-Bathy2]|uniref:Calcineurin-like phosphoesterase domain-containing protein n=1 Tax=Marine Group III euryarchaeote CG-Bathy2 TaxID=1889002 RepID=A0A1J5T4U1_9ARCH|nr:MAG: hypothetical protein BEU05_00825 [Marine Group III euryarchaeote CG-Bathy2]
MNRTALACFLLSLSLVFSGCLGFGDDDDSVAPPDNDDFVAPPGSVIFSAMGDVPYSNDQKAFLAKQITTHNAQSPSSFAVHVGDIKSGVDASCNESTYETVASQLLQLSVPTFIIPGDNEWNDCPDPDEAWGYWETWYNEFEQNWFDAPTVERQDVRHENFAFTRDGVLFVGINLVGGDVHDAAEWDTRMGQNNDWIEAQFVAHGDSVHAAVIFGHALPSSDNEPFFDRFVPSVENFGLPTLYLHGDGHTWIHDYPFAAANLLRVQVDSGGNLVEVTVLPVGSAEPFHFEREDEEDVPALSVIATMAAVAVMALRRRPE